MDVCFISETENGIFEAILDGSLDLESSPWPTISTGAKDLIQKMLTIDPKLRITAADALGNLIVDESLNEHWFISQGDIF